MTFDPDLIDRWLTWIACRCVCHDPLLGMAAHGRPYHVLHLHGA
jgi:hypothetical protein